MRQGFNPLLVDKLVHFCLLSKFVNRFEHLLPNFLTIFTRFEPVSFCIKRCFHVRILLPEYLSLPYTSSDHNGFMLCCLLTLQWFRLQLGLFIQQDSDSWMCTWVSSLRASCSQWHCCCSSSRSTSDSRSFCARILPISPHISFAHIT